jgi:hypothetical protein
LTCNEQTGIGDIRGDNGGNSFFLDYLAFSCRIKLERHESSGGFDITIVHDRMASKFFTDRRSL